MITHHWVDNSTYLVRDGQITYKIVQWEDVGWQALPVSHLDDPSPVFVKRADAIKWAEERI